MIGYTGNQQLHSVKKKYIQIFLDRLEKVACFNSISGIDRFQYEFESYWASVVGQLACATEGLHIAILFFFVSTENSVIFQ